MELKEGMYVRTKDGYIDKVIIDYKGYCNNPNCNCKHVSCEKNYYDEEKIIKTSYNLIDLIEEGDYVNGVEVIGKEFDNFNKEYLQCGVGDYVICTFEVKDIKTILTKEQFESQKYIVESE